MHLISLSSMLLAITLAPSSLAAPEGVVDTSALIAAANMEDNMVMNVNEKELRQPDLESWEPPYDLSKRFPYYLSGFDDDSRPIWIFELGRWNLKDVVDKKQEKAFDMYLKQVASRMLRSIESSGTPDNRPTDCTVIIDYENLKITQVASVPTMTYLLKLSRQFNDLVTKRIGSIIIVNANFVAESLISITRPIFGQIEERLEVFGTNKAKWMPELIKRLPKDQIPEWYGGESGYKPVKVYG